MTAVAAYADADRKRLGQFFSGMKVGRLLAHLAEAARAQRIIDPMAGSGDLLQACLDAGARPEALVGIEVDRAVAARAKARLPAATILHADAFGLDARNALAGHAFDLVIGNPPFVRYQASSTSAGAAAPDASAVRRGLLGWLDHLPHLTEPSREVLASAARSYSGLADLAAPSSLLAMALVANGGRLALVLPQSWLAREYSRPVRAALHRLFDVEYLVEDQHATWFEDVLVKATLVVATRVERGHLAPRGDIVRVRLGAGLATKESLVGKLAGTGGTSEASFAARLKSGDLFNETSTLGVDGLSREAEAWNAGYVGSVAAFPVPRADPIGPVRLPSELFQILGSGTSSRLSSLTELGVEVGQGLRTGANPFFYVTATGAKQVRLSTQLGGHSVEIPDELALPGIKDQRDLETTLRVEKGAAASRVLDFRSVALPEDIAAGHPDLRDRCRPLPAVWADIVRRASKMRLRAGAPLLPEMIAVATNARARDGQATRFWYMLPDFQPRHTPQVFVPRVVTGRPCAYMNVDRGCLIDANFVTFWGDRLPSEALLALLNSEWVFASLELSAAVLGGGALKVEAASFRRMGLPPMSSDALGKLAALGGAASRKGAVFGERERREIDRLLLCELVAEPQLDRVLDQISSAAAAHCTERRSHRPASGTMQLG